MAKLLVDLLKDARLLNHHVPREDPLKQKEWISIVYGTVGLAKHEGLLKLGILAEYSAYLEYLTRTDIWHRTAVPEDITRANALLCDFIKYCESRVPKNQSVLS